MVWRRITSEEAG